MKRNLRITLCFLLITVFLTAFVLSAFAETSSGKLLLGQNFENGFSSGKPNGSDSGNLSVVNKKPKDSSGVQQTEAYTRTEVKESSSYATLGGNSYLSFSVNDDAVGEAYASETDSYLDFIIYPGAASSYDNFTKENAAYYAFDADIATDEAGYQNGMGMTIVTRKGTSPATGAGITFARSGSTVTFGGTAVNPSPYQWAHLTVLIEVKRNAVSGANTNIGGSKVRFYLDGKKIAENTFPATGSIGEYISSFRFSMKGGAHTIEAGTLLADNVCVRSFGADSTLASLFASSVTLTEAGYAYYDTAKMPAVCKNGETYYASLQEAFDKTPSGAVIELVAPVYGFTVPSDAAKTVVTDGNPFTYQKSVSTVKVEEKIDGSGYPTYLFNNDCAVKFMGLNGTDVLEAIVCASDEIPAYSEPLPFFLADGAKIYRVSGWSKTKGGSAVTVGKTGSASSLTYYPVVTDVTGSLVYSVTHDDGTFDCVERSGSDAKDEAAFRSALASLQNGDVLTLQSDVKDYSANTVIPGVRAELDLNGHTVSVLDLNKTKAKFTMFRLSDRAEWKVYSSKPGAAIFNCSNGNNAKGGLMMEFTGQNYQVTIGNGTDNLSYYGSSVAYLQSGVSAENASVTLNGGLYCRNVSDFGGLFAGKSGTNGTKRILFSVNVKNATLISAGGAIFGFTPLAGYYEDETPSANVSVSGSKIYMNSAAAGVIGDASTVTDGKTYYSAMALTLSGTDVFGSVNLHAGQGLSVSKTCRFSSLPSSAVVSSDSVTAVAGVRETLSLSYNTFPSLTLEKHSLTAEYSCAVADASACHTVTWQRLDGNVKTVYTVGTVSIPNEETNSVGVAGKYEYRWQKAEKDGNILYTETAKSLLSVKAKLTFWSDFVYDIYLPVADADSVYVSSVTLAGTPCTLSEKCVIGGAEYYHLTFSDLTASRSAESFLLVLKGKTMDGVDLISSFRLSVPNYCEAVLKGEYGNEAKKLAFAILSYSKEAYSYFGKEPDADVAKLLTAYSAYRTAYSAKNAENIGTMNQVLSGATLILLPTVTVRFYLSDTYTGNGTLRISYVSSSAVYELTGGKYNGNSYVDLPLHASDLSRTFALTLADGGKSYSGAYSLGTYAESMKADPVYPLAQAISVFADAARVYKDSAEKTEEKLPEKDPAKIYLAENGHSPYRILMTPVAGELTEAAAKAMAELFRSKGIAMEMPKAETSSIGDYEIILGYNAKYRSNCKVSYSLLNGPKGFRIFTVNDKIVIAGASDSATAQGIAYFMDNVLRISASSAVMSEVTVDRTLSYQNDPEYAISNITLGGYPLSDYAFVVPSSDTKAMTFAKAFRDRIYEETGIHLRVGNDAISNKPFYIYSDKQGGATAFLFSVSNGSATLGCSYPDSFAREAEKFADAFLSGKGDLNYASGYTYQGEGNVLYYSQFGAKGDGVTDDFDALYRTHEAANTNGFTVRGDAGAVYYIGQTSKPIQIRTNTDWTGSTFIIDDTVVDQAHRTQNVFQVKSSYATKTVPASKLTGLTLKKGQTNIGLTFDEDCMIKVVWNGHKVYVRYGINENAGSSQAEMFLVDKNGNIDPSTPVAWDYDKIDAITVYSLKDTPITVEGGIFITKANNQPRAYTYYARNIVVGRPHTTLKNITHYIEGEGSTGAPYNGFFGANQTYDVTFEGLTFTGHKTYKLATDENNSMGTYDTDSAYSVKVTWKNCRQSNSITDTTKWGVHASNFCKDLYVIGCTMSRFDAHQGMYNVTVTDSTFGYAFNCIGGGLLYCKNVTRLRGNAFVTLRSDYGSTWDGDAVFIDCTYEAYSNDACTSRVPTAYLFSGSYTAGWDFGYTCYMPQNVTIDNFNYKGNGTCYVFWNLAASSATDPVNPYMLTKSITYRNTKTQLPVSPNLTTFEKTVIKRES